VTGKLYAKNWVVNTANGPYAEIDQKVGTLSFGLHEGTDSVYVQSGRDLRGESDGPLKLIPGEKNVAQIRFKVENLELNTEKELPQIRLYYTDHDSTREDKIQSDNVTFPAEYLENGAYYTATIPLSDEKYGSEPIIDRIRVHLFNVRSKAGGRVTIDYIYVGPVSGMKQNIYDDYLYFTFDNTAADQLRYKGSHYGSTASAIRNYDTTDYWKAVPSTNARSISGGCIVLTDNTDSATSKYNSIHAGSNDEEAPFTYRLTGNDVYRIRFKITPKAGETIQRDPGDNDQDPYIALEVGKGGIPAASLSFPLEKFTDGEFHTLTLPANTANLANNNISVLKYIRPTFSYIKGAVYTIDYIYVGPSNLADEVTGKADHIFFDFTNNDAAKSRYSNPVYGTTGTNFDTEKWAVNTATTGAPVYSSSNSTMSISPIAGKNQTAFPVVLSQTGELAGPYPLAYKPTGKDYFKIQMKITGASDTDVGFKLRYSDASSGGNSSTESTFDCRIPASAVSSEKFFVLEGYVGFGESKVVTSIRPEVYDLTVKSGENVTITYDYIYIGPLTDQKVTTDNLYFGFDNTPEDQARYANYTYGGYNFDEADTYSPYGIGQWATSYVINEINYDYTIDNKKGLLNIGVTDGFTGSVAEKNQMYGPTLVTTDRYGEYGVNANTSILRYRPNNASVAQLRFRLKNCQVAEKKTPRVVFLFGGYNADGVYVTFSNMSNMVQSFTPEDGFITLSIPLHQGFRDLALVTNIGFRIQHIYSPDDTGVVELDYFYVGTSEGAPDTYGYDSSYNTANLYSNGVSLYTEGNGVRLDANPNPAKYTETRFSFTGTGFDLISRTDPNQATIRVEIYTDPSYSKESRI
ncbi:MAG: hypothetical protein IKM59_06485, partial [Oscillospiraceae bacterium]|nr:hypothetical protein [Oscillospiraceae bacterium]